MLTPEQIQAANNQRSQAIKDRFVSVDNDLSKSEESTTGEPTKFFTKEGLSKYKADLMKGIDEGTVTDDQLEKAQEDLLSLIPATTEINGVEVEGFIQK